MLEFEADFELSLPPAEVKPHSSISLLKLIQSFERCLDDLKGKKRLGELLQQEKSISRDQASNLQALQSMLALSRPLSTVAKEEWTAKTVLILAYDQDLLAQVYRLPGKVKKALWLDLSRLSGLDDFAKIDFAKYQQFSKQALILIQKNCASKLGRWILAMEDALKKQQPAGRPKVTQKSQTELLAEKQRLQQLMLATWQPLVRHTAKQLLATEVKIFEPELAKKLALARSNHLAKAARQPLVVACVNRSFYLELKTQLGLVLDDKCLFIYSEQEPGANWPAIARRLKDVPVTLIVELLPAAYKYCKPLIKLPEISLFAFWQGAVSHSLAEEFDNEHSEIYYQAHHKPDFSPLKTYFTNTEQLANEK